MKPGKLSQTVWRRAVLKQLHTEPDLYGGDGYSFAAASASSCGETEFAGYCAVVKALNGLAARGVRPQAVQVQMALPVSADEEAVRRLTGEVKAACRKAGVTITGFQAEVSGAACRHMVFATAIGAVAERDSLRIRDAAPGQEIILCGSIALEGVLQILEECEKELKERFVPAFLRQTRALKGELLQTEAILAAREHVSVMRQIGSGGILAALWELAEEVDIGLTVEMAKMTICQETVEICEYYRLNPYQMTSAGGVLMLTDDGETLMRILKENGARAERLGVATAESARVIAGRGGERRFLDRPAPDELALWQGRLAAMPQD